MDGRIVRCGIISSCQSAATSEIVKCLKCAPILVPFIYGPHYTAEVFNYFFQCQWIEDGICNSVVS